MGFFSGLVSSVFGGGGSSSSNNTTSTNDVTVTPTTNVTIDLDELAQAIAQGNANDLAIYNASANLTKESQGYLNSFNNSLLDLQKQGIDAQKQGLNIQNDVLTYQQQSDAEKLELQQFDLYLKNQEIENNKQFLDEITSYAPLLIIGAGAYFVFKKGKQKK